MEQPPFEMPEVDNNSTQAIPAATEATQIAVNRTQIVAPQGNTTQAIAPVQCPICKQHNPPGDNYCVECGFLLSSAVPVEEPPQMASLPALRDPGGREYLLKAGVNSIGREGTDVMLADPKVSRRHAQLILENGEVWLEDLGSTNGTKLNGQRLTSNERAKAAPDASMDFGGVPLKLFIPEGWGQPESTAEPAAVTDEPNITTEAVSSESAAVEPVETAASDTEAVAETPSITAEIINISDPVLNQSFEITAAVKQVGRRPENDIVISNPYVSGKHATIGIEGGQVIVTDLGSTNGTFVNEQQLEANVRTSLAHGDELMFGQAKFRVEITANELVGEEMPVEPTNESISEDETIPADQSGEA